MASSRLPGAPVTPPGGEPALRGATTCTVVLAFTASSSCCIFTMRIRSSSSSRGERWSEPSPVERGGSGGASRFSGRAMGIAPICVAGPASAGTCSGFAASAGMIPSFCLPAISLANRLLLPPFSFAPCAGSFCWAARSAATRTMTSRNTVMTPPTRYTGRLFTRRTPDRRDTSPGEASGDICSSVRCSAMTAHSFRTQAPAGATLSFCAT